MSFPSSGLFTTTQRRAICKPLLIGITSGLWVGIPVIWGFRFRSWRLSLVPFVLNLLVVFCVYSYTDVTSFTTARQKEIYLLLGHLTSGIISYIIACRFKKEAFNSIEKNYPKQEAEYSRQVANEDSRPSSFDKIKVDLERVQEMKNSGLITEEEYHAMRAKILEI